MFNIYYVINAINWKTIETSYHRIRINIETAARWMRKYLRDTRKMKVDLKRWNYLHDYLKKN